MPIRTAQEWLVFIGLVLIANAAINSLARRFEPVARIVQGI